MTSWIQNNLKPILKLIGSIVATIGAIIMISATAKLAINNPQPDPYIYQTCSNEVKKDTGESQTTEECIENRKMLSQEREQHNLTRAIIDGGSMFVVGGILLLLNKRRRV